MPTRPQTVDPLAAFLDRTVAPRGWPIPLVATDFVVRLAGGLAVVETTRRFRNAEANSIEATMTFPVPIHATLFAMEARIDGRRLRARAQRRDAARDAYEQALEDGKAAVLHEEVLRGVHMLSVGHVPPGGEIEVTTRWAALLSIIGGGGRLRIPLTVGDLYGRSKLADSDDLFHAPVALSGTVAVHGEGAVLNGRMASREPTDVPMDRPIDIAMPLWPARPLLGRAADGAALSLTVSPLPQSDGRIDVAILVDRSGSMNERSGSGAATKHQAAVRGLDAAARSLRDGDAVALFTFDDRCEEVGRTATVSAGFLGLGAPSVGARFRRLVAKLGAPQGGTEIGGAIAAVQRACPGADILVITDGKSHALEVQALAKAGHRVTAVLVGADSLEANIGHLAALTGGDLFVAGDDLAAVIGAAVESLRAPSTVARTAEGDTTTIALRRGNARIDLRIERGRSIPATDDAMAPGVAAIAAAIELPTLPDEAAAALAEAEGLVTHLTSLIVVDDLADASLGVPSTRKVPLPSPAVAGGIHASISPTFANAMPSRPDSDTVFLRRLPAVGLREQLHDFSLHSAREVFAGGAIDWAGLSSALAAGDISGLAPEDAAEIEALAQRPEVVAFAAKHGLEALAVAVGITALAAAEDDRAAARIARAILGGVDPAEATALLEAVASWPAATSV